jgi:hypothetical protein
MKVGANMRVPGKHYSGTVVSGGLIRCDQCSAAAGTGEGRSGGCSPGAEGEGDLEEEEEVVPPDGACCRKPKKWVGNCCGPLPKGYKWFDVVTFSDFHITVEVRASGGSGGCGMMLGASGAGAVDICMTASTDAVWAAGHCL